MKTLTIPVNEILKSCKNGTLDAEGLKFYEWISSQFTGSIIVEAGTLKGRSARSFSRGGPSNLVISYDIIDRPWARNNLTYDNTLTKILDINEVDPAWFSKVDIIYLDISHNGVDETLFLKRIEPHFKGILIMDDINDKKTWLKLYDLFHGLDREHHILPDSIGATRGTGVVPYGDWTIKINEE
jgi:hypothetical protein